VLARLPVCRGPAKGLPSGSSDLAKRSTGAVNRSTWIDVRRAWMANDGPSSPGAPDREIPAGRAHGENFASGGLPACTREYTRFESRALWRISTTRPERRPKGGRHIVGGAPRSSRTFRSSGRVVGLGRNPRQSAGSGWDPRPGLRWAGRLSGVRAAVTARRAPRARILFAVRARSSPQPSVPGLSSPLSLARRGPVCRGPRARLGPPSSPSGPTARPQRRRAALTETMVRAMRRPPQPSNRHDDPPPTAGPPRAK